MLLPYFFVLSYKVLEDDEQHNDRKIRRPMPLCVGPVLNSLSDALAPLPLQPRCKLALIFDCTVTSALIRMFGGWLHA